MTVFRVLSARLKNLSSGWWLKAASRGIRSAGGGSLLGQQFQVYPPIVVDEEHILPAGAPLRNVMGTAGHHCPCEPWHNAKLPSPHAAGNHKIGGCPYL